MKLTEDDKNLLKNWGYIERDFAQINEAIGQTVYTVYDPESSKSRRISAKTALEILGRKDFLSGISRSAFHFTSLRENEKHIQVFFNSRKLFL